MSTFPIRCWNAFLAFWLRVSPLQALVEACGMGFAILLAVGSLSHELTSLSLNNVIFFTSVGIGFWLALRARLARDKSLPRLVTREVFTGVVVAVLAVGGIPLPLFLLQRGQIFTLSTFGDLFAALILACSGLAFYAARLTIWLLVFWNRLRKRSLMWALTNAHLSVVTIFAVIGVILLTAYTLYTNQLAEVYQQMQPAALFTSRLLTTLLTSIAIFSVLTIIVLAALLPPSALFSFLFARQTTNRLKKLIDAAHHLRAGNYAARVPVQGADEVAQLQADFNGMAETLEQSLRELRTEQARVNALLQARRELVASVSHELRTPVATLRGYLDAALDHRDLTAAPDLREDLDIMRRETVRLQGLIDDLFTLSRAEVQGLALAIQAVDADRIIHERVAAAAPLAWQTGRVEVLAEIPPHLPPVQADPVRLEQVLVNLLRNAIRYTPPGGIIAVTAALEDGWVRIDVRDTGQGIAPEDLPLIWERFYRGSPSASDPTGGAGIGLALVKELTEAMGGSVSMESKAGEGSCFTVRLKTASI